MKHFFKAISKEKLSTNKINLIKFLIEKFVQVKYYTENHKVYTFFLEDDLDDTQMEMIVDFYYSKFNEEIFFENSITDCQICDQTMNKMVEELTRYMHTTNIDEKFKAGWVYGAEFSFENKTSPLLVPYDQLPEQYRTPRVDVFNKVIEIIEAYNK